MGNAIQQTGRPTLAFPVTMVALPYSRLGYYGLSRAVSSLGLQTEEPLAVDVVVSQLHPCRLLLPTLVC